MENAKNRMVWPDVLRIIASVAVMLLHVSADNWGKADLRGLSWNVFNVCDSLTRWGVPVFVMVSGMMFLDAPRGT